MAVIREYREEDAGEVGGWSRTRMASSISPMHHRLSKEPSCWDPSTMPGRRRDPTRRKSPGSSALIWSLSPRRTERSSACCGGGRTVCRASSSAATTTGAGLAACWWSVWSRNASRWEEQSSGWRPLSLQCPFIHDWDTGSPPASALASVLRVGSSNTSQ